MEEGEKPRNYGVGRGIGPIASTSSLAEIIGVTKTRIGQLVQEGVLRKEERGKFALCDNVNRYVHYLRNQPKNQWGAKDEGETDFERERLRRTKEEADKLELANAKTRGELVEVAMVKKLGEKVMAAMKTRILNLKLSEDEKDKILRDLLSLKDMDFSECHPKSQTSRTHGCRFSSRQSGCRRLNGLKSIVSFHRSPRGNTGNTPIP